MTRLRLAMLCLLASTMLLSAHERGPWVLIGRHPSDMPALANLPFIRQVDLVLDGYFLMPTGSYTDTNNDFYYSGIGLTYNAAGNSGAGSFYIGGHAGYNIAAETTIPPAVNSTAIGDLSTATILQNFADVSHGSNVDIGGSSCCYQGGMMVYGGRLINAWYNGYDTDSSTSLSHAASSLTLSSALGLVRPQKVGADGQAPWTSHTAGSVSNYMMQIPAAQQSVFGAPAATGGCCLNIIGRTSSGPSLWAFDPARIGLDTPVAVTPLTYHSGSCSNIYPIVPGSGTGFTSCADQVSGVVWPAGTRTVLFFGQHTVGPNVYGTGVTDPALDGLFVCETTGVEICYYDPYDSNKGQHGYPYIYEIWAYDAVDLLAVKNHTMNPNDVYPYAMWQSYRPITGGGASGEYTYPSHPGGYYGATYNVDAGKIYASHFNGSFRQIFEQWHVGTGSATKPVPPTISLSASPATTGSVRTSIVSSGSTITLTATAADADGSIASVKFYAWDVNMWRIALNTDTVAPYSYVWTPPNGIWYAWALATDNQGNTSETVAQPFWVK